MILRSMVLADVKSNLQNSIMQRDLHPFVMSSFLADRLVVRFREPLVLTPTLTESKLFMKLQHEQFGIDLIAETRKELQQELEDELRVLWRQSQIPDKRLGTVFRKQKAAFLEALKPGDV